MNQNITPANGIAEDEGFSARRVTGLTAVAIFLGAGVLHFGSDVFLPLSIATLIAFALSPMVSLLRRNGMPHVLSVLVAVTVAASCVGGVLAVMATQLSLVVESLPTYQSNILSKLDTWQSGEGSSHLLGELVQMASRINDELSNAFGASQGTAGDAATRIQPVTVAVVQDQSIWEMLQTIVLPIISPIVTAGLIIVVIIFVLMEREELRDRFIRLLGSNDLHRTTEMLEDAGGRVASYLVTQIVVNVIYAVPIGVGLWFIGVPNASLWALMTLVLRFVPYFGSVIAAGAPLLLAFAVSPGWSMLLWTGALFLVVELITSNIVEPRLYGSRTGLTPLAVIIAAIVWTWIWGPMGLILSTPLTVCLVVLGRYLPQFQVFHIMFGDEPVLAAHERLYQRLLAGDSVEAVARAEEALEDAFLADVYQSVGVPALLLAQSDYDRGVLSQAQEARLAASAGRFVSALEPVVSEERSELPERSPDEGDLPPRVVVSGGRSNLDDVAARMLGQSLAAEGAEVATLTRSQLNTAVLTVTAGQPPRALVLCFLDPNPARATLLIVRRIKRSNPGLRVGIVVWQMSTDAGVDKQTTNRALSTNSVVRRNAEDVGVDFVATTMDNAVAMAMADEKAQPAVVVQKQRQRRTPIQAVNVSAG